MLPIYNERRIHRTPVVTYGLIATNVLVWIWEWLVYTNDPRAARHTIFQFAFVPSHLGPWLAHPSFSVLTPYTMLTAMFLHASWLHIIGNMWFLYLFGRGVEDLLGRAQFLAFYLISGLCAGLVYLAFSGDSNIPTLGASGAIAGVMGAYCARFPKDRIRVLRGVLFWVRGRVYWRWYAWVMLLYWFGWELLFQSAGHNDGVAHAAHIGGFLTGLVVAFCWPGRHADTIDAAPEGDGLDSAPLAAAAAAGAAGAPSDGISAPQPSAARCAQCGAAGRLADGLCFDCWGKRA